jgi:hypothetical protein
MAAGRASTARQASVLNLAASCADLVSVE